MKGKIVLFLFGILLVVLIVVGINNFSNKSCKMYITISENTDYSREKMKAFNVNEGDMLVCMAEDNWKKGNNENAFIKVNVESIGDEYVKILVNGETMFFEYDKPLKISPVYVLMDYKSYHYKICFKK